MLCGRCGTDVEIFTTITEQDGNVVTLTAVGVCPYCKEPFGCREFFHLVDWEYLSKNEAKKVLDNIK